MTYIPNTDIRDAARWEVHGAIWRVLAKHPEGLQHRDIAALIGKTHSNVYKQLNNGIPNTWRDDNTMIWYAIVPADQVEHWLEG